MRGSDRMPRLLVVEDEPNILELLSASLRYAGFDVVTAAAGTEAVQAAQRHRPDLIVLDVMLPDMDGFDVIRRLRGGGARIPVVFLTARDATEDQVRAWRLGGDDYVAKPFSLEEVIARIRAVLRRTRGDGVEPTPRPLDRRPRTGRGGKPEVWRGGEQIQLSPTEFKLLRYFMSNSNRVLSKMQILDHVWDYDFRWRHRHRRVVRVGTAPQGRYQGAPADPHPAGRGIRAAASVFLSGCSAMTAEATAYRAPRSRRGLRDLPNRMSLQTTS